MTRKEKLISMNGALLIQVADKLGVKVSCNKSRTALKEAKMSVVERILAAEENQADSKTPDKKAVFTTDEYTGETYYHGFQEAEPTENNNAVEPQDISQEAIDEPVTAEAVETAGTEKKAHKKANLKLTALTYKGETKSIKEWAAEINMPWPTLYDRVNRNGWPIDLAIETPLGQRRSK